MPPWPPAGKGDAVDKLTRDRRVDRETCGVQAVARITGWDPDRVVLHIRALRERHGRTLSLRGGTYQEECWDVLRVAGWWVEIPYARLRLRDVGWRYAGMHAARSTAPAPSAWFLCYQTRHVFAFRRRDDREWTHSAYGRLFVMAHRVWRGKHPGWDRGLAERLAGLDLRAQKVARG